MENYRLLHNWVMAQHMQCKNLYSSIALEYFVENESIAFSVEFGFVLNFCIYKDQYRNPRISISS